MLKKIAIPIYVIIAISPFILIAYHFYSWVEHGEVQSFPFTYALYHWLGIDATISNVSPSMEGFYMLYIYIMRLPLLLWLFIFAIPCYIKIYKLVEN